jgi:hypothetical protein
MPLAHPHAPAQRRPRGGRTRPYVAAPVARGLLAPGSALALPSLAGVPSRFLKVEGAALAPLQHLAHALVDEGAGTWAMWDAAEQNVLRFAQLALRALMPTETQPDALYEVGLQVIVDGASPLIALEPMCSAPLTIGPIADALVARGGPRLARAWWEGVWSAVASAGRWYDWQDAEQYMELVIDGLECGDYDAGEDDADYQALVAQRKAEQAALIPVWSTAKPLSARAVQRLRRQWSPDSLEARAFTFSDDLAERAKSVNDAVRAARASDPDGRDESHDFDGGIPLPHSLVRLTEHDPISAMFDEEAQGFNEAPAPTLMFSFGGTREGAVCGVRAIRALGSLYAGLDAFARFTETACTAARASTEPVAAASLTPVPMIPLAQAA